MLPGTVTAKCDQVSEGNVVVVELPGEVESLLDS